MANSPGPSTSKTADPNETTDQKKKKRTRRKPRSKKKIHENAASECVKSTEKVDFVPNFVIESAKQQFGVFYKVRDKASRPINLKFFVRNGARVFYTSAAGELVKKIENLGINGVCLPRPSETSQKKADKKRKKKKVELFMKFLSEEEVEVGLKNGGFMKGNIRINPKNFKESYVGNEDITKSDYIIGSVLDRNRALEGDEVVLRLKKITDEGKKLMEVVYITQKVSLSEFLSGE